MQNTTKIYNLQSLNFLQNCHLNIGILGGSFDPAHNGHVQISCQALKMLNLDYVIWLVALQNPLKCKYRSSIFARSSQASKIVKHPRILVSSAEYDMQTYRTYDSLNKLTNLFTTINFTFLMGIDNINNFHKWYKYQQITDLCKIIIFDRPNSEKFDFNRLAINFKAKIDKNQTGAIMIYRGFMSKISSSSIRENLKG